MVSIKTEVMQTAVEWLGNEITNRIIKRNPHDTIIIQTQGELLIELIEQAKEMEKEQMKQLMWDLTEIDMTKSNKGLIIDNRFDTYWDETFKSE